MIIPLKYIRLFVDATGLSHFQDCTLPLAMRDFAPPTTPLEATDFIPALGFAVVRFAANWSGPWHASPYRQWFFMMSGSITVTAGDGIERTLNTGDAIFLDDQGTKGHLTRVNSDQEVIAVSVRVADVM